MPEKDSSGPGNVPRRGFLALALLGGASASLSILNDPHSEVPTAEPLTAPKVELTRPVPKDQRLIGRFDRGPSTSGYSQRQAKAFSTVRILDVVELVGLGETAPWLAVAIVGTNNELQIVDPSKGKIRHVLNIPDEYGTGLDSLAWDPKHRKLYLSVDSSVIMWDSQRPSNVTRIARVENATTLYSLDIDESGNVFGGTYPSGSVFKISTKDNSVRIFKRLADDSDYVRNIAVDEQGNVWAGTGASNPRVFFLNVASDSTPQRITLPESVPTGFVSSIRLFDSKVVVSASSVAPQMVYDREAKSWLEPIRGMWSQRVISRVKDGHFFAIIDKILFRISAKDFAKVEISRVSAEKPYCISNLGERVIVYTQQDEGILLQIYNVSTGSQDSQRIIELDPSSFKIQSIVALGDDTLYLGGYKARSISSISLSTGDSWNSSSVRGPIQQIEGMVVYGTNRIYVGSYPGGDIISMDVDKRNQESGYKMLARLGRKYHQSRPFGWATNAKNVFFGTVPDYGLAGGVVGMIDPVKDEIVWVLNAKSMGIAEDHSIVGLCADDEYLFGTTSVRNGYGIPDTKGDGTVFKLHIASKKVVWSEAPVKHAGALYSPTLLGGWLLIADHEGIKVVDKETGTLAARHDLLQENNAEFRAGWSDAKLVVLNGHEKLIHSAHGKCTIVNLRTGKYHQIGTGKEKFGNRLAVTPGGSVYNALNQTDLVRLDLAPLG